MAAYKTKQRDELIDYFAKLGGKHTTAIEVCNGLKARGSSIGLATVYRQLEKLVDEGIVKKYFIDEGSSACFEYVKDGEGDPYPSCFHLKCEKCNKLIHLDCDEIKNLEEHISRHHGFVVDPMRTVFYGLCMECATGLSKETEGSHDGEALK
ncbi:MAG: transcriptional repressor [Lachnospiraceae bacterium]|nr:transcriptional repressor [Lachnospiraceae bacterium]